MDDALAREMTEAQILWLWLALAALRGKAKRVCAKASARQSPWRRSALGSRKAQRFPSTSTAERSTTVFEVPAVRSVPYPGVPYRKLLRRRPL